MKNGHPYRVVLHGAPHFCRRLQGMLHSDDWDVRYVAGRGFRGVASAASDLRGCDLVYVRGGQIRKGKFLHLAQWVGAKRLVMVWIGSDALVAKMRLTRRKPERQIDKWIASQTHWAVSPWVADEVRSLGLACEHVTESCIPTPASLAPLPAKFSVLAFLPNAKPDTLWLYGWDYVVELARQLPSITFTLVGLPARQSVDTLPNIRSIGRVSDLTPVLQQSTVLLRLPRHDGLSWMVQEALAQGRHVIYTYPFPSCTQAGNIAEARAELDRLLTLHQSGCLQLNESGARFIAHDYNPESVRANVWKRWEQIVTTDPVNTS